MEFLVRCHRCGKSVDKEHMKLDRESRNEICIDCAKKQSNRGQSLHDMGIKL